MYIRAHVASLNLVLRQPQERAEGRLVGFLMLLACASAVSDKIAGSTGVTNYDKTNVIPKRLVQLPLIMGRDSAILSDLVFQFL